ncbi:glutathionylspermidine synthase family protein [Neobacillus sp. LXY-4]|uniref:glutathionylspermidine synthase family protein n=1 Tax=Neobacillus sp. LXY-4 TaxID=3379826 RepID=UPI003EDEDB19
MNSSSYQQKRKQFFAKVENFWPDLYGEEYALYDVYQTNRDFVKMIHQASGRIGSIFYKTAKLLRQADDEILLEMGFPRETLSFLRITQLKNESVIARLDLVPYGGSVKCLELNSDTPTFIKEVFAVNEFICSEFGLENPNTGMEEKLSEAVQSSIIASITQSKLNLVFTAHHDHLEDLNTALYLQKLTKLPAKFVPLKSLQIKQGEGLYDEAGNKIDILYRQTYPIENLILDKDEQDHPIGLWLLELVALGKLSILNPPSAFLLQNKTVHAVIWGLHEQRHPYFTSQEHEWIDEYFLPTYLEPDPFLKTGTAFVKKPSFGREGDTVEIYDGKGMLKVEDSHKSYMCYTPVYQQYIELPEVSFTSEKGVQTGHMIIGSFLLNGEPGGIGCRVGNPITDNLSYFLPIGIR